jgi:hypothetical protein
MEKIKMKLELDADADEAVKVLDKLEKEIDLLEKKIKTNIKVWNYLLIVFAGLTTFFIICTIFLLLK